MPKCHIVIPYRVKEKLLELQREIQGASKQYGLNSEAEPSETDDVYSDTYHDNTDTTLRDHATDLVWGSHVSTSHRKLENLGFTEKDCSTLDRKYNSQEQAIKELAKLSISQLHQTLKEYDSFKELTNDVVVFVPKLTLKDNDDNTYTTHLAYVSDAEAKPPELFKEIAAKKQKIATYRRRWLDALRVILQSLSNQGKIIIHASQITASPEKEDTEKALREAVALLNTNEKYHLHALYWKGASDDAISTIHKPDDISSQVTKNIPHKEISSSFNINTATTLHATICFGDPATDIQTVYKNRKQLTQTMEQFSLKPPSLHNDHHPRYHQSNTLPWKTLPDVGIGLPSLHNNHHPRHHQNNAFPWKTLLGVGIGLPSLLGAAIGYSFTAIKGCAILLPGSAHAIATMGFGCYGALTGLAVGFAAGLVIAMISLAVTHATYRSQKPTPPPIYQM